MTAIAATLRQMHGVTKAIDKAWLASLLIIVGLAAFDRSQAMATVNFTLTALTGVAPWLLLSVAIAASAAATGADHLIARAFQGQVATMVVLAALMGALSPFCSCGVIPLIAALLAMGVPLAPVMAFWLASPVMDPAMFTLTVGALGLDFAIAKTLAAIGLGLLGGLGTAWMARAGLLDDPLRPGIGNGGCGGAKIRNPKPPVWSFWQEADRRQKFAREAGRSALFLGKWLTFAFILESLMLVFVPGERVAALVGGDGVGPILLGTLVGVPAYLNGYAALPLVAGLLEKGMSAGAALAFLVAGGVSSIPAAIAVWALVKRPVFALYLGFAFVGSFAAGLIFQAVQ